jgi:Flp pilus assembly pilin Flp
MSSRRFSLQIDEGQTMAEYTVILGMITLAIVTTISLLSDAINVGFTKTLEVIQSAF